MSHDLGLGGPCEVERDPDALHGGPCFDGVYGCHRCWNAANNGKGTSSTCERCRANDVLTRVVRASDEPVLYAICQACQTLKAESDAQAVADYEAEFGSLSDEDYE